MANEMSVRDFRDLGYLQEINRQFLHPLGLALSIIEDEEGNIGFGKILNYQAEDEGIRFSDSVLGLVRFLENYQNVKNIQEQLHARREELFGFVVQPVNNN